MKASRAGAPRAFTLVELLTVIAIIALLISILVPSLNVVRTQARSTKTSAQLSSTGKGCEMYQTEFGKYPRSYGQNPFEQGGGPAGAQLPGAQWLALQLAGPDLRGYVDPRQQRDTDDDGEVFSDPDEWQRWYEIESSAARRGPYVELESGTVQTFVTWRDDHPGMRVEPRSDLLAGNDERWRNERLPFFVDPFGYPILYYAANTYAKMPFSTGSGSGLNIGRYDQSDNAGFTGNDDGEGRNARKQKGLDPDGDAEPLSGSSYGVYHPLGILGFDAANPRAEPPAKSFAGVLMDRNIFETNRDGDEGRVWPYNAEGFLLISPGKDGLWGTKDDIGNFRASQ